MGEAHGLGRRLAAPRCLLSSPASRPVLMQKAAASAADTVMIDLEDAVFPDSKEEARAVAIDALETLDWGKRRVLVRVNGLDTPWGLRDVVDISRVARLDGVLVPKVESAEDVRFLHRLLEGLGRGREPLELHVLIESARAVGVVEAILGAGPIVSASFGSGDYAISVGALDGLVGLPEPAERAGVLPFEHAKARFVTACHASGVAPLDGPYPNVKDDAGCEEACRLGRALGFVGKWAIHPGQISIVNDAFAPGPARSSRRSRTPRHAASGRCR
jgi:malyl-CoA/(S)-citramalyl-CoA lyase